VQRIEQPIRGTPFRAPAVEQRRLVEVAPREEHKSEPLVREARPEVRRPAIIDPSPDVKSPKHGQEKKGQKMEQKAQPQSERPARGEQDSGEKKEHKKNSGER
jgi:hypothetical protein